MEEKQIFSAGRKQDFRTGREPGRPRDERACGEEERLRESFWLAAVPGMGNRSIRRLLSAAGEESAVLALSYEKEKELVGEKRAQALERAKREPFRRQTGRLLERILEKGIGILPCWRREFPWRLRQIPDPPYLLFYKGNLPNPAGRQAALVGARACSSYGREAARYFARRLAESGVGVVSGMASGIDGIAQRSALEAGGHSTAALGCGVDVCYPAEMRGLYEWLERKGCLFSEYMPGTKPQARLFPPRNRLISGLSDLVLVIEARERSGTLITVDMALEQGREVFAVPGRVWDACSRGCNRLISSGAGIAVDADTVLEALGVAGTGRPSIVEQTDGENGKKGNALRQALLAQLSDAPKNLDELADSLADKKEFAAVSIPLLMQELAALCVEKTIGMEGGKYYLRHESA